MQNLWTGEFRAHLREIRLCDKRLRMSGAEDPPSPLGHVLQCRIALGGIAAYLAPKSKESTEREPLLAVSKASSFGL